MLDLRNGLAVLLIAAVLSRAYCRSQNSQEFECLIESLKQPNEYLSSSNDTFRAKEAMSINPKHKIYIQFSITVSDVNQIRWNMVQVNGTYDTYLMRNAHSNEYLCANNKYKRSSLYISKYGQNKLLRFMHTTVLSNQELITNNKCKWKFQRIASVKSVKSYIIWNGEYTRETLLVESSEKLKRKRNEVYTSHVSEAFVDPDERKWMVHCN
jgi:hypothetical protein